MPVRNARRAANAANLVRSAMDPRDIDALTPSPPNTGLLPLGFGKIAPAGVRANSGWKTALKPLQPGGKEAVEAAHARVGDGPMARQRAAIAAGIKELGKAGDLIRADRLAADVGLACQQGVDLLLAFLGFERTDAINNLAALLDQANRSVEQPLLQADQLRQIGLALEPAHVWMAADRARGRTGRIDQHGIERTALPFGRIGDDHVGVQAEPHQVLAHPYEPVG